VNDLNGGSIHHRSFAHENFAAAWYDNDRIAISAADPNTFLGEVRVLDLGSGQSTALLSLDGASAGVSFDHQGNLFTGNGFDLLPGGSDTGDIRAFLASDIAEVLSGQRRAFNFADSGSGGSSYGHWGLFHLAAWFHNPLCLGFQVARARGSVEDLLYYEPFESKLAMQDVALDKYFRVTEVVTMRSSWTDPNALFVGVKAGRNGIAHAHQDLGSFAFYGLGEK